MPILAEQLVGVLDVGVLVFSAANRLLYWNAAAAAILERDLGRIQEGAAAEWLTLREDGSRMPIDETPLARALTQGIPSHRVVLGDVAPGGRRRWLEVSAVPLPAQPDAPPAAVLSISDISERRRAEQDLQAYHTQLEALVAERTQEAEQARRRFGDFVLAAPVPICVFARDGTLTLANRHFWATFGYPPEQILGLEDWWQCAYPDPAYRREVARHWLDLHNPAPTGSQALTSEQRVTCADGAVKVMDVAAVALRDGVLATFVDVSERLASAGRLQQVADLNVRLIEAATQGMLLYRADGRCVVANEAAARLLGIARTALLAQDFGTISGWAASGLSSKVDQVLADGIAQHVECEFGSLPGERTWLAVDIVRVAGQGGEQILLMFDDITRFRAEAVRLREDKRMAEDANRSKSTFLANMSHEIRNPLNAIMGVAEVLKDDRLDQDQRGLVDTISAAGRTLLEIVNDILDFARIEAGRLEVEQQAFDLGDVLAHSLQLWSASAERKGLLLALDTLPSLPARLIGDAARLGQILSNLISNAIKFTDHGQIRIGVDLVNETALMVSLRFRVRDTGRGIPADKQTLIFEPFVQLDGMLGARGMGTGLGLAISRELAVLLGGSVGVESTTGIGSEFWVQIPFRRIEAAEDAPVSAHMQARAAPTPMPAAGSALAGRQILLVDDNPVNLEVAARLLEREGATVYRVTSGIEALHWLVGAAHWPAVILLDVQMPGMDGLETCRRIRQLRGGRAVRILALSAGAMPHQRALAREAGMDDFIAKPFELRDMVGGICRVLAVHPASADSGAVADSAAFIDSADSADSEHGAAAPDQAQAALPPAGETAPEFAIPDTFPNIRGHDRQVAWRRMQGDRELYLRSLRLFDVELVRISRELGRHLEQVNAFLLGRHLHRLKGAGAMVGAVRLAASAEFLEDAVAELVSLQAAQGSRVAQLSPQLRDALQKLMQACDVHRADLAQALRAQRLQQALPGTTPGVVAPPSLGLAQRGAVHALIGLLERRDLAALDLYRDLERPLAALLALRLQRELRRALDALAFDRAAAILRELLVGTPPDRDAAGD